MKNLWLRLTKENITWAIIFPSFTSVLSKTFRSESLPLPLKQVYKNDQEVDKNLNIERKRNFLSPLKLRMESALRLFFSYRRVEFISLLEPTKFICISQNWNVDLDKSFVVGKERTEKRLVTVCCSGNLKLLLNSSYHLCLCYRDFCIILEMKLEVQWGSRFILLQPFNILVSRRVLIFASGSATSFLARFLITWRNCFTFCHGFCSWLQLATWRRSSHFVSYINFYDDSSSTNVAIFI